MEIVLGKMLLKQVGVTSPRTAGLITAAGHRTQRIVVGDTTGVVTCFGLKKTEPVIVFQTLPGPAVRRVLTLKDKIFVATNSQVRGISRKGKVFFEIDTCMSESILSLQVQDNHLYVAGEYTYSHYVDNKDVDYYMPGDRINDLLLVMMLDSAGKLRHAPVLACNDRALRLLKGSEVLLLMSLSSSPTALTAFHSTPGDSPPLPGLVVYGTNDGTVGMVKFEGALSEPMWEIPAAGRAAVTCVHMHDITGNGRCDLLVGRDDGTVQIFSFETPYDEPECIYSHRLPAAITALCGGKISSANYDEVIAVTFGGHVFCLSSDPARVHADDAVFEQESKRLEEEIAVLQAEVRRKQGDYDDISKELLRAQAKQPVPGPLSLSSAVLPDVRINLRFALQLHDASYLLSLETPNSIDTVVLQCDVPVDVLDVKDNTAAVSFCPMQPQDGNFLLAMYKCEPGATQLSVKIRSIEGKQGTLRAYVSPNGTPRVCRVEKMDIKALSLHSPSSEPFDPTRPNNKLELQGNFTLEEMHSWVAGCVPNVPVKAPPGNDVTFVFVSALLGTQLRCVYRAGSAVFTSDNISTIAILRDVMSRLASQRQRALTINCDMDEASCVHVLKLLKPKLDAQHHIAQQVNLLPALKELQAQEGAADQMLPEYRNILEHGDQLEKDFQLQPCFLERLHGMIADLYIDKYKFKGMQVTSQLPQLNQILADNDFEELVSFFDMIESSV
eukprot:m.246281 g.246281  ORF g.246281 m.246281 type:complete len:726 (+) comp22582_c0_seq3:62-2239(+)